MSRQQERSSNRLTLDQASRLLSEALNAVLTAVEAGYSVDGVSIFRIGDNYFIDVNLLNEANQQPWSLSLQLGADVEKEETT